MFMYGLFMSVATQPCPNAAPSRFLAVWMPLFVRRMLSLSSLPYDGVCKAKAVAWTEEQAAYTYSVQAWSLLW